MSSFLAFFSPSFSPSSFPDSIHEFQVRISEGALQHRSNLHSLPSTLAVVRNGGLVSRFQPSSLPSVPGSLPLTHFPCHIRGSGGRSQRVCFPLECLPPTSKLLWTDTVASAACLNLLQQGPYNFCCSTEACLSVAHGERLPCWEWPPETPLQTVQPWLYVLYLITKHATAPPRLIFGSFEPPFGCQFIALPFLVTNKEKISIHPREGTDRSNKSFPPN